MKTIDCNVDIGEGFDHDFLLLPFVSSANIACGAHAGSPALMRALVKACKAQGVAIGAHPGYADPDHFGRQEMLLAPHAYAALVKEQVLLLKTICEEEEARLHHVKPHGALYNQSAKDPVIASAIATAIFDIDPQLFLYGLSGSVSLTVAAQKGLRTVAEVFADRTYQKDGSLTPRSLPGALIQNSEAAKQQALQMVSTERVNTLSGEIIAVKAETICLHGDGEQALVFAQALHSHLKQAGIVLQAP